MFTQDKGINVEMIKPRKSIQKILPYRPGKPIEELKEELGLEDICRLSSMKILWGLLPRPWKPCEWLLCAAHVIPMGIVLIFVMSLSSHLGGEYRSIGFRRRRQ